MHPRRKLEFMMVAVFVLCAWFLFDSHFSDNQEQYIEATVVEMPWYYDATGREERQKVPEQEVLVGDTKEQVLSSSAISQYTDTPTQSTEVVTPTSSLLDRVVVMAKLPTDDTDWVHAELQDWQSAIYDIDTATPHNVSTLDPLTNNTLRTLRNKGTEANAYLAYIVQHYDRLPSTIAFLHPHKDGYPAAWHTDNQEHSNVQSLQNLNIEFVQRNGYANLRCVPDPGCPHEVMPFRDPPEEHRTIEAAMPDAWRDLFDNTDVPHIMATPCCAQFAVSSQQVRQRPLEDYRKYYTWLMETPLKDETSGRVFEYLWHILFGQDPVYCPAYEKCYCDVYNVCQT